MLWDNIHEYEMVIYHCKTDGRYNIEKIQKIGISVSVTMENGKKVANCLYKYLCKSLVL